MKKLLFLLILLPGIVFGQEPPQIKFHHNGENLFLLEINADKSTELEFNFGDNITDIFETQTSDAGLLYLGQYKEAKPTLLKINGITPEGSFFSSIVLDFKNTIFTQDEISQEIKTLWQDATGETTQKDPWWTHIFPVFLVIIGFIIILVGYFWSRKDRDGNELLPDNFWDDQNVKEEDIIQTKTQKETDLPFEVIEK